MGQPVPVSSPAFGTTLRRNWPRLDPRRRLERSPASGRRRYWTFFALIRLTVSCGSASLTRPGLTSTFAMESIASMPSTTLPNTA